MKIPAPQFIIFTYCILSKLAVDNTNFFSDKFIIIVIISIIISSLSYFFSNKNFAFIISGLYVIISFIVPEFITMSPLILYNSVYFQGYLALAITLIFITSLLFNCISKPLLLCMLFLGIVISCYLSFILERYNKFLAESNKIRDDTIENNLLLQFRNKSLLEKQDYEIYNATLKERNRIAREIHDNVGHILSRSILLTGVLKTVNKDDNCAKTLENLHDSLNNAMESIRESVHNLHDDSVNLKETAETILNNFVFCNTNMVYDMGTDIPREVKFSFIAILKESLNNICRHSNATDVNIIIREHPAMYQLIIKDNGTTASNTDAYKYIFNNSGSSGIGLSNIYSRVNTLGGSLQIHTQSGFCIFITVPKI